MKGSGETGLSLLVDIEKSLGAFRLRVRFEAGDEVLALLGASGCGKSMTLKCIAGIEKPDRGRIVLDGEALFDSDKKINLPPRKRGTGYLFQNYALFPNMTVEENIASGISLRGSQRAKTVSEKIKAFYLNGLEKRYPPQLSGGQQQRVALARILASNPRILMLDEPFSALDSYLKWQLEMEMADALERFGGTTLFVSHNRDEVYRLCDKIAVLSEGEIDALCGKWELFKNPKTLAGCLLTGCKNISQAIKVSDYQVLAREWGITFETSGKVPENVRYVGVRAHYFKPCEGPHVPNSFECRVLRVIEDPFSMVVVVANKNNADAGSASGIRWELPKEQWHRLKDKPLVLRVSSNDILLMAG